MRGPFQSIHTKELTRPQDVDDDDDDSPLFIIGSSLRTASTSHFQSTNSCEESSINDGKRKMLINLIKIKRMYLQRKYVISDKF